MKTEEKRTKAIEKLKEEFKKSTNNIEKVIVNYCLLPEVKNNDAFLDKILDEKKSVSKMLTTISSWIRKSKNHAPSHDVIFSLAIHYYQEEKPEFVVEMFDEAELKFGDVSKELDKPVVKYITGTIIREIIKEVTKGSSGKKYKSTKKQVASKVKKTIKSDLQDIAQLSLFEE